MKIIRFVKQVCTIALGCFLSLLSLLWLCIYVVTQQRTDRKATVVAEHTALTLPMEGLVVESGSVESMWPIFLDRPQPNYTSLKTVKKAIRAAVADDRIKVIYLKLSDNFDSGWAVLEEIREALLAFKKAGKTIVAYGNTYSNKSYYLASVADEIVLHPEGVFAFNGLSATIHFYTQLLENISVKPVVFRIGDYKSAVEPFCCRKMSQESRQQREVFLEEVYAHFLEKISLSRGIPVATLKTCAQHLSAVLPIDALQAMLITKVDHEEGIKPLLKEQYGPALGSKDPCFLDYRDYLLDKKVAARAVQSHNNKVAIVTVEGDIIEGYSRDGSVGSASFVEDIKAIQKDDTIQAVVLRVNSPGGSAMASSLMCSQIEELKKTKQVVASLSSSAASGGYYVVTPCQYIFAQPTTLTGSIGIFAVFFDPALLMQKVGIESDVVKTTPSADLLNPRLTFTAPESQLIYKLLEQHYTIFLNKVAKGRKIDVSAVEKLAGGKIYTGNMALKNGLVDALGNLEAAIEKAAELASLKKYDVVYFPRDKTKWERLFRRIVGYIKGEIDLTKALMATLSKEDPLLWHYVGVMRKQRGIQAMLPYTIDFA